MRGTVHTMTPRRTASRAASAVSALLILAALPATPARADATFTAPAYPSAACTPVAGGLNLGIAPQQWNSVAGLPITPSGTPAAQKVVIGEFDQTASQAAVNLLLQQCGLSPVTFATHTNSNGQAGATDSGLESTLDVTVAAAALPSNASITLVNSPMAGGWYGLFVNVAQACGLVFAGDPWAVSNLTATPGPSFPAGGCIASISYGGPESGQGSLTNPDWVLNQLAANGVIVAVSAGDEGSGGCISSGQPPITNYGNATLVALSTIAITSEIATLTTSTAHSFSVNQNVFLGGIAPNLDGMYRILSVPTMTTFTVGMVYPNLTSTTITGAQAAVNFGSLVPQYPASHPTVLAVGGTQWNPQTQSLANGLAINYTAGASVSNNVWWDSNPNANCSNLPNFPRSGGEATGGGQSPTYAMPSYQQTVATANYPSLPARRMMPDVAGLAGWPTYAIANPGITIIGAQVSSNVASLYTAGAHGITTGELVTVASLPAPFTALNVTNATVTATTTTTLSYNLTAANISAAYVTVGNVNQSCVTPCTNTAFPWYPVVGTSAATPLTAIGIANVNAALTARGLSRITNDGGSMDIHSIVYSSANSSAFRDVTAGSNDIHTLGGYAALTGFDMATGMGVPNFTTLANLLIARLSPSGGGGGGSPAPEPTPTPTPTPTATPAPVSTTPVTSGPNPVIPRPTVENLGGGVKVSQGSNSALVPRAVAPEPASSTRADAPIITIPTGTWRVPIVRVPGASRDFAAQIRIRNQWESLGEVTSNKVGKIALPAIRMAKPGIHPIRILDARGRAYFITLQAG